MEIKRVNKAVGRASVLLALLCGSPAVAQKQGANSAASESEIGKPYFESIDVNVVNIDVYVTDKKGNRIDGLTVDDFEVFEDRRPVKVTNFYAVEGGKPVIPGVPPSASAKGGARKPAFQIDTKLDPVEALPEDQRLHLIIYFDNLFMKPLNRNKVIREVRNFLHSELQPNDQVMLATFERWLHIRQTFTANRRLISSALSEIDTHQGLGAQASQDRKQVIRSIDMAVDAQNALSHVRSYADEQYLDMENSIRALKEIVDSMAGLPGRKALLYVSDGIPMSAAQDLFLLIDFRFPGEITGQLLAGQYSVRRRFSELSARANANRVTFYTLEAAGLRSHGSLSAEHGGAGGGQLSGGSMIEVDVVNMSNRQEPLQLMAVDTGGLAAFNTNNLDGALADMAGDFQNYYSLGYSPVAAGSGRYHRLEVKVKRRGLKVRHRTGFREKSPETRVYEGTLAALVHGLEKNPLEITVNLTGARPDEDNNFLVPLEVRIPFKTLALIPHETLYRASLRVSIAVIDDEGRVSAVEQSELPIEVPAADVELVQGKFYVYSAELLMRPGLQKVAVGVRDDIAGESSFVQQAVEIGG